MLLHYLVKRKMTRLSFPTTAVRKTYIEIHLFLFNLSGILSGTYYRNMLLTQQQLPVIREIFVSSLSPSKTIYVSSAQ